MVSSVSQPASFVKILANLAGARVASAEQSRCASFVLVAPTAPPEAPTPTPSICLTAATTFRRAQARNPPVPGVALLRHVASADSTTGVNVVAQALEVPRAAPSLSAPILASSFVQSFVATVPATGVPTACADVTASSVNDPTATASDSVLGNLVIAEKLDSTPGIRQRPVR